MVFLARARCPFERRDDADMNIVALVKYIPDPNSPPQWEPDHRLRRVGLEGTLDPGDEHAVEAGLALAEATGGEVTVITMGPEPATAAVRKALSMGAHRGVVVTDDLLQGADALATARTLAAAIGRSPFDVVLAGVESTDGYTGTLPMTIAELLGVPSVTFARRVEVKDGRVVVERQTETGYDVVESPLPAVVSVTAGANEPRYPTLKGIMQAKSKPTETLSVADLGLAADAVRATQEVMGVEAVASKEAGEIVEDPAEAPTRIVAFLREAKVI
jgi:electron transfer flavoprotein beta subunit